jgi:NitT/TauT family transport system substrate-binding protein
LTQSCPPAGPPISPLETLNEVPCDKRRGYDAEDTVQFCALRLHESGLIKANPKKIIAEKTD